MTLLWKPEHLSSPARAGQRSSPLSPADIPEIDASRWFWDFAPVVDGNNVAIAFGDAEIWLALSAPKGPDATARHFEARLSVLLLSAAGWRFVGELMPEGAHPGNREWAGMAVLEGDRLRTYFTSAGVAGHGGRGYQQRLFESTARMVRDCDEPAFVDWSVATEFLAADEGPYLVADQSSGEPGFIRAFRDPFWFNHLNDGPIVLFTATSSSTNSKFNGAIGAGRFEASYQKWTHIEPLVLSCGVTTELERPHIVVIDDLFYLFWSTQSYTFASDCPAPTGLYGAVSDRHDGGYRLLNESGLVLANPKKRPFQAYSWFVTHELRVQGFVDLPNVPQGRYTGCAPSASERFAGNAAPQLKLHVDGATTRLIAP